MAIRIWQGRWQVLLAAALGGVLAFGFGWKTFRTKYTAQVQLVRREMANTFKATELGESFRPRQFNTATVSSMMRSGKLMEETGSRLSPAVTPAEMQTRLEIRPEKNTDLITIAYTSPDSAAQAVAAVNLYAEKVVDLTRNMQCEESGELLKFIDDQLNRIQQELSKVQEEQLAYSRESGVHNPEKEADTYLKQTGELDLKIEMARIERETLDFRIGQIERELAKQDPAMQRLRDERDRLAELLGQFTPQHPSVVTQMAKVASLEAKATRPEADPPESFHATGNTVANSLYLDLISLRAQKESLSTQVSKLEGYLKEVRAKLDVLPDKTLQSARLAKRAASLDETRGLLAARQREARLFADHSLGYYRLFAPVTADDVEISSRNKKTIIVTLCGAILLGGLTVAWRALGAALDDRIVSPSDLRRAVRAPVIATLAATDAMDESALARWRFQAWAKLVREVPAPPQGALIAGLMSAGDGEGKSFWMAQLGRAALDRGLKVIAVSRLAEAETRDGALPLEMALGQPLKVLEHLRAQRRPAAEFVVAGDDGWKGETGARWRQALEVWRTEPGLVVLVELPPASRIEALLLAETLPALLWVCDSGKTRREDLSGVLAVLSDSGLRPAGAILNRMPPVFARLPDLAKFGLCLGFSLALFHGPVTGQDLAFLDSSQLDESLQVPLPSSHDGLPPVVPTAAAPPVDAADPPSPPALIEPPELLPETVIPAPDPVVAPPAPVAIPKTNPALAPWQQRLELGPGDLVNLQVFGHKEYTRTQVPVGPDGTINYLQVHGFKAAGRTIDELRESLTKELQAYIRNAQIIVTPAAWRSKKYILMGTVLDRGVFTLDRPMTLLEAAARARGIATGLMEQNTVEIADMRRAFIVRGGKKLAVDFNKLFYQGDLSQNVQLEPGDYIYFPSNVVNEVYVLGAVGSPGTMGVTENLTAIGAITVRGGFAKAAWKHRVLVVRGPLDKPQVFPLDANAILAGKGKDMVLQPRDLVFVAERPWKRAEEVLDVAVKAFLQAGTATWVNQNVNGSTHSGISIP